MRINNGRLNSSRSTGAGAPARVTPQGPGSVVESTPAEAADYVPSAELTQLTELARKEPEVREALVQEAKERLDRGDYLTQESTERTAAAILSAHD